MPLQRKGPLTGGGVVDEDGCFVRRGTEMRELARGLRGNQTGAEKMLWKVLRRKQMRGLRFYRQVAINRYVVDFYCPAKAIIVEVDGGVHSDPEQEEHDHVREEVLRDRGFRLFRVSNSDVFRDLEGVLQRIAAFVDGGGG